MQHSKKSNRFHRIHRTGYDQNLGRFHPYAGINHLYRVQLHSMEATRCTTANCKLTHTHTHPNYTDPFHNHRISCIYFFFSAIFISVVLTHNQHGIKHSFYFLNEYLTKTVLIAFEL